MPDSVPDAMSDDMPNVEAARGAAVAADEVNFEICVVCSWFRDGGPAWFLDEVWDKSCKMHGSYCLIRKMPDEEINPLVLGGLVIHPPPVLCLAMSRIELLKMPNDVKMTEKKEIDPVINNGPLQCYEMSRVELLRQRAECECPPNDAENKQKKKNKKKKNKKEKEKNEKNHKEKKNKEKKKEKNWQTHPKMMCYEQSRIELLREWHAWDAECAKEEKTG